MVGVVIEAHPIRELQDRRGLSNRKLAPLLGVSEKRVRGWLKKRPTMLVRLALCEIDQQPDGSDMIDWASHPTKTPLRAFRDKHALTQKDLAIRMQVNDGTVQRWEKLPKLSRVVEYALRELDRRLSERSGASK